MGNIDPQKIREQLAEQKTPAQPVNGDIVAPVKMPEPEHVKDDDDKPAKV